MLSQCVRDFVSRKRVWSVLYYNSDRDLTMDGTCLQGALPFVRIIIHKPSITVILRPFHLVSHHNATMLLFNQDVSFYSHARFYVQGSFYFRNNILPNRPTDFNQWGGPTCWQKLLCSKWLCEERCAVTLRQLLLHKCCECGLWFREASADTLLHERRREADSLSLAGSSPPLVEPGHSQESASWLNIGANQWDRHPRS